MSFAEIARVYVNYIEPSFKAFLMFIVVMAVLAFWAKLKENDFLDISKEIFDGTIHYTYKAIIMVGMGIWFLFRFVGQALQALAQTINDFFSSKN